MHKVESRMVKTNSVNTQRDKIEAIYLASRICLVNNSLFFSFNVALTNKIEVNISNFE